MASHGVPRVAASTQDKSEKAREKERKQIEQYKSLENEVNIKIKAGDFSNATLQLTSKLLTQNPEYYTIWNHRRVLLEAVIHKELSAPPVTADLTTSDIAAATQAGHTPAQHETALLLREDLAFLVPLLRQFPKCYWIWNHRAWLLRTATTYLPAASAAQFWQAELGLVSQMLALDNRNFHGWGYRRHTVAELETLRGDDDHSMAETEFEYTTKMIRANLSNFSAWHYRGRLIPSLLDRRRASAADRRAFLDAEFELLTRALYTDPYDQSLWFYHQSLMSSLDPSNPHGGRILDPCTDADRGRYLEQEIVGIREMLDGAEDSKYIYQALLEYSERYLGIEGVGAGGKEEGEEKKVTAAEMKGWLEELRKIDPLREGRWNDLAIRLGL